MAYCSSCGKAIEDGSKFCSGCGTTLSGAPPAAAPITGAVVVKPRSGGLLALTGFLTALLLAFIFVAASKNAFGLVIAFSIGAAYIIISLRKWKRSKNLIHGAVIAWTVAVLLLLVCSVGLMGAGVMVISKGMMLAIRGTTNSTSSETPTDPKDALLRNAKLDFKWHKDGFGNIMIADFTIKNPTRYRFKDFEIKCTHSAPSGTVIDSNTQTIYETVEPKSTRVVKQVNMGFINSQAAQSGCEITDLVVLQ